MATDPANATTPARIPRSRDNAAATYADTMTAAPNPVLEPDAHTASQQAATLTSRSIGSYRQG